jgi:hypothetical protein
MAVYDCEGWGKFIIKLGPRSEAVQFDAVTDFCNTLQAAENEPANLLLDLPRSGTKLSCLSRLIQNITNLARRDSTYPLNCH